MISGMLSVLLQIFPPLLKEIPYSTAFILVVSGVIALLTTFVNRLLTNPQKTKAARKELADWNKELREAQKQKDKKTVDKLMKKQQYIMQLQTKMMWSSMKVSLLFLIPLLLMWQVLGGFYSGVDIAYLPGLGANLPIPLFSYSLIWWYLVCSLLFGTVCSHLLGIVEVSE